MCGAGVGSRLTKPHLPNLYEYAKSRTQEGDMLWGNFLRRDPLMEPLAVDQHLTLSDENNW